MLNILTTHKKYMWSSRYVNCVDLMILPCMHPLKQHIVHCKHMQFYMSIEKTIFKHHVLPFKIFLTLKQKLNNALSILE